MCTAYLASLETFINSLCFVSWRRTQLVPYPNKEDGDRGFIVTSVQGGIRTGYCRQVNRDTASADMPENFEWDTILLDVKMTRIVLKHNECVCNGSSLCTADGADKTCGFPRDMPPDCHCWCTSNKIWLFVWNVKWCCQQTNKHTESTDSERVKRSYVVGTGHYVLYLWRYFALSD